MARHRQPLLRANFSPGYAIGIGLIPLASTCVRGGSEYPRGATHISSKKQVAFQSGGKRVCPFRLSPRPPREGERSPFFCGDRADECLGGYTKAFLLAGSAGTTYGSWTVPSKAVTRAPAAACPSVPVPATPTSCPCQGQGASELPPSHSAPCISPR